MTLFKLGFLDQPQAGMRVVNHWYTLLLYNIKHGPKNINKLSHNVLLMIFSENFVTLHALLVNHPLS